MRGGRFDALLLSAGGERRVACGLTVDTKRFLEASLDSAPEGRAASSAQPLNELEVCDLLLKQNDPCFN